MVRRDFQNLSVSHVREAKILAAAGCYDGAYYLGGVAVECALKSAIARATQRYEFPDLDRTRRAYTHNLEALL
jgi:HEPN domain-containing protein